ncbi:MAG: hypothetical protein ACTS27_00675 [Phycisphaerales bacterium]
MTTRVRGNPGDRRGFVLPTIILLIFVGSLVVASALERYSTQQLIVQQQIEGYRRHHDVQGAKAVLGLWLSRQNLRDLGARTSTEVPAHRFELPGGRRIAVYLIDGQGLAKADASGEAPAMREAYEKFQRRIPAGRPDLFRRLGPMQISVNSAPEDILAALAPDGRDLAPVMITARRTERLNQANTRTLLTDFGYDTEQIAEIFRLIEFEPSFLRTVVEVEDPNGVMRFAAYIDGGNLNEVKRAQVVEWRQVDEEEAATLLLRGPTENPEPTRGTGRVGQTGRP